MRFLRGQAGAIMHAEDDSGVARPDALGGGGGGSRVDCSESSLLSAYSEGADVWVRRGEKEKAVGVDD